MEKFDPELNALKDRKGKVLNITIELGKEEGVPEGMDAEQADAEYTPDHPDEAQDKQLFKDMMAEHAGEEAEQMKHEASESPEEETKEHAMGEESDEESIKSHAMGKESPDDIMEQFSKRPATTLGEKVKLAMARKMKGQEGKA